MTIDVYKRQEHNYQVDICQPVDMFPQTHNIENIIRLSKKTLI